MSFAFVDFEQPIAELLSKIEELRLLGADTSIDIQKEVTALQKKADQLTKSIFSSLDRWQIVKLARHPARPYSLDYFSKIFTDFIELHGDRQTGDDPAIVGGTAKFDGQPVMVIGQQKGRKTKENIHRNFGMPRPEGYRKALRLMRLAEKFNLPVFTFIDTPGADPGAYSEERNQNGAIATNLAAMASLKTPIIATIIGEGGSGGALAIGVADSLLMLKYSVYSVISPEGCASILWKDASKANLAADALKLCAHDAIKYGLADKLVEEPLGGAHRDIDAMVELLRDSLRSELASLTKINQGELLDRRYLRLTKMPE